MDCAYALVLFGEGREFLGNVVNEVLEFFTGKLEATFADGFSDARTSFVALFGCEEDAGSSAYSSATEESEKNASIFHGVGMYLMRVNNYCLRWQN